MRTWDVDGRTIRVALHHTGTEDEANAYADAAAAIVDASKGVYGELPEFDFGTYTFLACYLPWADGDGMEHRNSTVLTSSASLADNRIGLLGTVAHEFFHAWNVERIRPDALEPFDFEAANVSGELWFAEGFTSYFDDLILWRAGLIDDEDFAQRMGGIANAVTNARGRRFYSPVEMSMQAPFVDAATAVDPNNRQNTFLSYYTWGSGIALALDLELRTRFPGVTLDHLMREMWRTHGLPFENYDVVEIQVALARVSGDSGFASDFFDAYVRGREAPEYAGLLASAGIVVAPSRPDLPWVGQLALRFEEGGATVLSTPLLDTPLHDAGVDRGDRITSIDGVVPSTRAAVDAVLARHRAGDTIEIRYESRGGTYANVVMLRVDPTLSGTLAEGGGSAAEQAFRAAWKEAPGA
jgi:predicted metalloprotease with PDZ domain